MHKILLMIASCLFTLYPINVLGQSFTAYCRDYPPELSFDGSECVGVLPDLVTDIFNEMGHEILWVKAPWIRSLADAKAGKVDLLIRHSMTPERELFLLAAPYAFYLRTLSFYKSPLFKSDITSYDELKKARIGAIRGNYYSPSFSYLDTRELSLVGTTQQLLAMLEKGRIDLAVTSKSHSLELFSERFEKISFVDSFYNPMYISVSKKSKAALLYDEMAKILLEYRKSGKINRYFNKYGLPVPEQVFE